MPRLTNFKIAKVFKGKSGEGEYGPWTIYNFYVDHFGNPKWNKVKFGYLHGGNKPLPTQDSDVDYIEYEVVKDGKYTNYRVKTLALKESEPEPEPEPEPEAENLPSVQTEEINRDISYYVSYAKDLEIARLSLPKAERNSISLGELVRGVVTAGKEMLQMVREREENKLPYDNVPIDESGPFQEPEPDDIPI